MRLFYAAFLSPDSMRVYRELVDDLQRAVPGALRQVPRDSHHLTLVFLGEVPADSVADCVTVLGACEESDSFPIGLDRPRILMGRGRPRLIYTDVTGSRDKVAGIQAILASRLSKRFPELDLRPKPPHVTLARFHRRARRSDARLVDKALTERSEAAVPGSDHLRSVHLVESSLTPTGPVYETVAEARLSPA